MSHCICCFDEEANHCDVTMSNPTINTKYKAMQILINLCLLLLSTFTPAGSASNTAGITSLNPRMPIESLLPVTSYNFQPNNTGDMRRPAMKRKRAMTNQKNSRLMCGCFVNQLLVLFANWQLSIDNCSTAESNNAVLVHSHFLMHQ